jgi:2-dehydro-3-deoxy-D-arabinonate dehydratase
MELTRIQTMEGPRWAVDGWLLPADFCLGKLMELPVQAQAGILRASVTREAAAGAPLAPVDPTQEVWAAGVTYLRSREAREAESATGDIYQRVYTAERPELFFKAPGWRVVAPDGEIHVRRDSRWNVPEPELTLVINCRGEVCGYTAGNDVSSRDIEGENPLYLPQAKVYNGSCALGPRIRLVENDEALRDLTIQLEIRRGGMLGFAGETSTRLMKRTWAELAAYLFRELDFPQGALLMTGTGIVPPEMFSLQVGDTARVTVGELSLENVVA